MKSLLFCAVCGILFSAFALTTQAQSVTFAQFLENNGTQDFVFTNSGGGNGTFSTVGGGSSISFRYQNITGLNSALTGFQDAHLTITPATTTALATINVNNINQPMNETVVISITRDTATPVGVGTGSRRNLLTATIAANTNLPGISGTETLTTGSANFSVATPDHIVTFTSDFLSFSATTQRNLGLSFSSVAPRFFRDANNILQSFTAAGTGTFASNPVPTALGPTAASVTVSGRVLTAAGRGLSGAQVNLTDSSGALRTVITNPFGYYYFSEVSAGQTAILSVDSKRYTYTPQVIAITEDVTNLNFTADK